MNRAPVVIAGGGLAGAAAALWLARAGEQVLLLERERTASHKICGEFLSWETQAWLKDLGLDLVALGAHAITRIRLVAGGRTVAAPLPFTGLSLTRHRLDAALLDRAEAAGAEVQRGCHVRALEPDGTLSTSHGAIAAPRLMVATGKHGLRGHERAREGTIDHQIGLKTYFRLTLAERQALAGHVELILFEGGYAGLQLVERDMANLCLLVSPERYQASGGRFDGLLQSLMAEVPHLARRLSAAVPLIDRPLAIASVPYGFRWRPPAPEARSPLPVGDQALVIPSFTGDGMGLSLHGSRLAVETLLAGGTAADYARRLDRDAGPALRRATLAQRLVGEGPAGHARLGRIAAILPPLLTLGARLTRLPPAAFHRAAGALPAPGRQDRFA
jgi:flavin-dependent dehydrogenase